MLKTARLLPNRSVPQPSLALAARNVAHVGIVIVALALIDQLAGWLLELLGIKFPSFVLGMVGLFACLALFRLVSERAVDKVSHLCAPAASFLGRWMALFFAPPLVLVPMQQAPKLSDFVLLVLIGGGGFVASFWFAGFLAQRSSAGPLETADRTGPKGSSPWPVGVPIFGFGALGVLSALVFALSHDARAQWFCGIALSVVAFSAAESLRQLLLVRGFKVIAAFSHPVLLGAALIGLIWQALGFGLLEYLPPERKLTSAGGFLIFLLRPSVVSLAFALDAQRRLLRAHLGVLLLATGCSAVFSLFLTALCAGWLGLSSDYARAILSRSVTTPVALSMAEALGADAGLTAMLVILTGVMGALTAVPLAHRFGFRSPFVLGVATGSSSHGIGTAGLVKANPAAAAFSGIAFALMAVWSSLLVSSSAVRALLFSLL